MELMTLTLRAHVANGRIVVDEPVDLPDGTEIQVEVATRPSGWTAGGSFVARGARLLANALIPRVPWRHGALILHFARPVRQFPTDIPSA